MFAPHTIIGMLGFFSGTGTATRLLEERLRDLLHEGGWHSGELSMGVGERPWRYEFRLTRTCQHSPEVLARSHDRVDCLNRAVKPLQRLNERQRLRAEARAAVRAMPDLDDEPGWRARQEAARQQAGDNPGIWHLHCLAQAERWNRKVDDAYATLETSRARAEAGDGAGTRAQGGGGGDQAKA